MLNRRHDVVALPITDPREDGDARRAVSSGSATPRRARRASSTSPIPPSGPRGAAAPPPRFPTRPRVFRSAGIDSIPSGPTPPTRRRSSGSSRSASGERRPADEADETERFLLPVGRLPRAFGPLLAQGQAADPSKVNAGHRLRAVREIVFDVHGRPDGRVGRRPRRRVTYSARIPAGSTLRPRGARDPGAAGGAAAPRRRRPRVRDAEAARRRRRSRRRTAPCSGSRPSRSSPSWPGRSWFPDLISPSKASSPAGLRRLVRRAPARRDAAGRLAPPQGTPSRRASRRRTTARCALPLRLPVLLGGDRRLPSSLRPGPLVADPEEAPGDGGRSGRPAPAGRRGVPRRPRASSRRRPIRSAATRATSIRELTHAVKRYLERRLDEPVLEWTTFETVRRLREKGFELPREVAFAGPPLRRRPREVRQGAVDARRRAHAPLPRPPPPRSRRGPSRAAPRRPPPQAENAS